MIILLHDTNEILFNEEGFEINVEILKWDSFFSTQSHLYGYEHNGLKEFFSEQLLYVLNTLVLLPSVLCPLASSCLGECNGFIRHSTYHIYI